MAQPTETPAVATRNQYNNGDIVNYKALYKGSNATDTYDDGRTYHDNVGFGTITSVDTTKAVWYQIGDYYVAENDITGIHTATSEKHRWPVYYSSAGKRFVYISGELTSTHSGTDLGRCSDYQESPDIVSATSGVVVEVRSKYADTAGRFVTVRYDDYEKNITEYWQYKHLESVSVSVGQTVCIGDKLGVMGGTGGEYDSGTGYKQYTIHLHADCRETTLGGSDDKSSAGRQARTKSLREKCYVYPDDRVAVVTQGTALLYT